MKDELAYRNLKSLIFWQKCKEAWDKLMPASKLKWLDAAINLTEEAWTVAAAGTDALMPVEYDDFKFYDVKKNEVYSYKMLYATFSKKCKNTWNAAVVGQILSTFMEQYKLRDTGEL